MNTPFFTPSRLALVSLLLVGSSAQAEEYSWNNSSGTIGTTSAWSNTAHWLVDGMAPATAPGAGDDIITPTVFGRISVDVATATVSNWTIGSSSNQLITGAVSGMDVLLNINGTLSKAGSGTVVFRSGDAPRGLIMNIGELNATDGVIVFGRENNGTEAVQSLRGLTIGSANLSGTTLFLGVANANGNQADITGDLSLNSGAIVNLSRVFGNGYATALSVGSLSSNDAGSIIRAADFTTSTGVVAGKLILNNSTGQTSTYAGEIRTTNAGTAAGLSDATSMSVEKRGGGTQIFSGANSYNGTTEVFAGTLLVHGTHAGKASAGYSPGAGDYTVFDGGRLGGSGTITFAAGKSMTVNSGGVLWAGAGAVDQSLTINGDLVLEAGSMVEITLGAEGSHSTLVRTGGDWSFANDQLFTMEGDLSEGTFGGIISGLTGSEAGLDSIASWSIVNDDWVGTFSYDSGSISLTLTLAMIPEPSSYALLLGAGAMLFAQRRRYRA